MVLMEFVFAYVVGNQFSKRKYLLELIKGRSKVHQKNMWQERGLNFDQWKTFSENHEPIRAWLWLVYEIGENNCRLILFVEFIQIQKSHPASLDKIIILTWGLLIKSSQNLLVN